MKLTLTIKEHTNFKEYLATLNALTQGSGAGKLIPQFPNTSPEHPDHTQLSRIFSITVHQSGISDLLPHLKEEAS